MRLPQLASIRYCLRQSYKNILIWLGTYYFGSSPTWIGSSSIFELLETIRNSNDISVATKLLFWLAQISAL